MDEAEEKDGNELLGLMTWTAALITNGRPGIFASLAFQHRFAHSLCEHSS